MIWVCIMYLESRVFMSSFVFSLALCAVFILSLLCYVTIKLVSLVTRGCQPARWALAFLDACHVMLLLLVFCYHYIFSLWRNKYDDVDDDDDSSLQQQYTEVFYLAYIVRFYVFLCLCLFHVLLVVVFCFDVYLSHHIKLTWLHVCTQWNQSPQLLTLRWPTMEPSVCIKFSQCDTSEPCQIVMN